MIPTTTSSPITLLSPAGQSAKMGASTDSEAPSDAASSGFELLLGALQKLQPESLATGSEEHAETDSPKSKSASPGIKSEENGNPLPQLGTLLPAALPSVGQLVAGSASPSDKAQADEPKKQGDGDEAGLAAALGLVPVNSGVPVPAASPPASVASSTRPSDIAAMTVDGVAVAGLDASESGAAGNGAGKTTRTTGVSLAQPISMDSSLGEDAAAAVSAVPATLAPPAGAVESAPVTGSDFDALVKHFDEKAAQPLPAVVNGGDSASVSSASRTYTNAANNSTSVPVPVGSSGWGDAIADKVMWFSANKVSSAEIHLSPPDLGPLQVRVSLQHDQASVVFTSQHAAVRDALDQALPRLRDMMGSQGMHLLDVSVGGQSPQQQSQQQFSRNGAPERDSGFAGLFGEDPAEAKSASVTTINAARLLRSGVDAYA